MACVYPAEPIDFSCIVQIIAEVRGGSVTATTVRKLLKQIDSGIALFGTPQVGLPTAMGTDSLCDRIEEFVPIPGRPSTNIGWLELILLLIELWKQLQPILNPPAAADFGPEVDYGGPPISLPPDLEPPVELVGIMSPELWHMGPEWEAVWAERQGEGIILCSLDTGYATHSLGPEIVASKSFIRGQSVVDGNGHGTHTIGTMCGRDRVGCAPKAKMLVGKVLSNQGSGGSDGITAGIRWAADNGAHIINMSLGGGGSYSPTNQAIDYAWSKGCWVAASAGNSGYNGSNTIGWPSKYEGCLCTGAYQRSGAIANFSSGGTQIDWACPGQDIVSFSRNGSGFASISGTSMSNPHGVGVLALIYESLLRGGYPIFKTAQAVRDFFALNMRDVGAPGFDVRFGHGVPVVAEIMHVLRGDFQYV